VDGQVITSLLAPVNATAFFPADGRGLNPLLRHPGMIIHPPMLYLGFVSFVIPYAFAMAALITGRSDDRWIRLTRRWTLWAWLFLSFGLVLGSRWAYDVLGWGGFWGWDPVEIAALMPWLTGTAFLHSVMIQEKRGLLKHWNMILVILTYALVIFGTFLTRSGVLSSVHAFAQSAIGPAFFAFIGATFITSIALLIHRWPELRSETEMHSVLSREALFLLNNLLFISILVVCFWGVIFPLISELVTGQKVTVGPPFYNRATAPLFATLMLLMGIAPLSAWGHSTIRTLGRALWKSALLALLITAGIFATYTRNGFALIGFFLIAFVLLVTLQEFWRAAQARMRAQQENFFVALWTLIGRNRRRYGGYIIHISMMLMAIGILGIGFFQIQTQGTLPVDGSLRLGEYTIKYESIADFPGPDNRWVTRAVVGVYGATGNYLGEVHPRIDDYLIEDPTANTALQDPQQRAAVTQQRMTIPGERATLKDDLYVLLVDWQPATANGATFKIFVNPLVNWLWIGAIVFLFGILVAAWPDRDPETVRRDVRRSEHAGRREPSAAD
jgi:cytochrome c-type biogenesis protein CcmF